MGSPLCVDASVVVRLVVPTADGQRVHELWEAWQAAGRSFVAPSLLSCEVANALYRYERAGELEEGEVDKALDAALNLPVRLIEDPALHAEAGRLARRFALPAAYDAHYLAVAERLGAELWTADRRLFERVRARAPWVHSVLAPGREPP